MPRADAAGAAADTEVAEPAANPLIVRAGRSLLVATDELLAHLPVLESFAEGIDADVDHIAVLALEPRPPALCFALQECGWKSKRLADGVRALREAIATAQTTYARGEAFATSLQDALSAGATNVLARAAVPLLPGFAAGMTITEWLAPGTPEQRQKGFQRWLLDNPEHITSPEFSTLVRRIVSNTDDAVLGAAGLHPFVTLLLGEQGLGILGVDTTATALLAGTAATGGSVLTETGVRVDRTSEKVTAQRPEGAAERLDRVPGEQQVLIERYTAPGEPSRYVVYVAPTQTFSPVADSEPWDLTSNVAGVAGLSSGSIRATEFAMVDAGITADSEVVFVGYSQGGLVADAVVASGKWNAVGLETYGDPGGGIPVPDGVRGVAVRHTDDFVVALGGAQQPSDRTIVERRAFAEGESIPNDLPVPAHQKRAYSETARALDAARSPEVRAELDALDSFTRDYTSRTGSTITSFSYRAERIPAA